MSNTVYLGVYPSIRVLNDEDFFYEGLIHVPSVLFNLVSLISGPTSESLGDFDQVLFRERGAISDP